MPESHPQEIWFSNSHVPMNLICCCCCSVTQLSNSLRSHGLQHDRLPCPSLSPGVFSNSCLLIGDANLTISSSATPFFCLQSFPAPGSFPISQLFSSAGQSIGASTTVLPMNIQGWFPLGLTGMISLQSKGLSSSTIYYNYFLSRQIKIFSWSFNTKL